jgi:hypothetical protein
LARVAVEATSASVAGAAGAAAVAGLVLRICRGLRWCIRLGRMETRALPDRLPQAGSTTSPAAAPAVAMLVAAAEVPEAACTSTDEAIAEPALIGSSIQADRCRPRRGARRCSPCTCTAAGRARRSSGSRTSGTSTSPARGCRSTPRRTPGTAPAAGRAGRWTRRRSRGTPSGGGRGRRRRRRCRTAGSGRSGDRGHRSWPRHDHCRRPACLVAGKRLRGRCIARMVRDSAVYECGISSHVGSIDYAQPWGRHECVFRCPA